MLSIDRQNGNRINKIRMIMNNQMLPVLSAELEPLGLLYTPGSGAGARNIWSCGVYKPKSFSKNLEFVANPK